MPKRNQKVVNLTFGERKFRLVMDLSEFDSHNLVVEESFEDATGKVSWQEVDDAGMWETLVLKKILWDLVKHGN